MMEFNQAQLQAVRHDKGPCMVLAGPGSGKTTVITNRISYLIQACGVRPDEILVVTFSRAAAAEMRERFCRLGTRGREQVTFGTFHGIYYGILKWAYKMNADHILSETEKFGMLSRAAGRLGLADREDHKFLQDLAAEISELKNNRIPLQEYRPASCEAGVFSELYEQYERERRSRKKLDFDDMLLQTFQLFTKRPDILKLWQEKYSYILIDEFQDINQVQYDVIRMLAEPQQNLFIVGDDDQAIYRFRGSRPEIMLGFTEAYPDAKQILLNVNYRSAKEIVDCAERLICRNRKRYPKEIVTAGKAKGQVSIKETADPVAESRYVVSEVQKELRDGKPASEIAVLFRTNSEASCLAETCVEYAVPFQMKEQAADLYEHFIAKDLVTYMKMALGDRSRASFLKIMNRPNRYIARESVETDRVSFAELFDFYADQDWMQERIGQFEADLELIGKMAPYGAIRYIRNRVGYDAFLDEYAAKRGLKAEDLYETLGEIEERAKAFYSIEEWFAHIEDYQKKQKQQKGKTGEDPNAIRLMTMHSAKGLEFDTVFLIGANETITPYKKAVTADEIEEERRLFYVAATRAKNRLVITYANERGGKRRDVSRFVEELRASGTDAE